jgi:hypothetical protein
VKLSETDVAKGEATPPRAIRAINGSVASEEASNIHAGLCEAEIVEIAVAQVLVVSQPPPWLWLLLNWV